MLLKIFTKRKSHGEIIETEMAWKDSYLEGAKVRMTPLIDKGRIDYYVVTSDNESESGSIDLATHGYELYLDSGVVVDKYVTAIKE